MINNNKNKYESSRLTFSNRNSIIVIILYTALCYNFWQLFFYTFGNSLSIPFQSQYPVKINSIRLILWMYVRLGKKRNTHTHIQEIIATKTKRSSHQISLKLCLRILMMREHDERRINKQTDNCIKMNINSIFGRHWKWQSV